MEWVTVSNRTDYVSVDRSVVAVYYISDDKVVLIDAGGAKSEEFLCQLEQRNLHVAAILCTHLHFDHLGNAEAIQQKYHAKVYASERESLFPKEMFANLVITKIPVGQERLVIDGALFSILPTPGHTEGHLAYITPDAICCVGDALMSHKPLRASKFPYMEDADQAIFSMEILRQTQYQKYVAAHEGVVEREELSQLIDMNIQKELDIYAMLRGFISEPMDLDWLPTAFMKSLGIQKKTILDNEEYQNTILARLKSLAHAGEIVIQGNKVIPNKFRKEP